LFPRVFARCPQLVLSGKWSCRPAVLARDEKSETKQRGYGFSWERVLCYSWGVGFALFFFFLLFIFYLYSSFFFTSGTSVTGRGSRLVADLRSLFRHCSPLGRSFCATFSSWWPFGPLASPRVANGCDTAAVPNADYRYEHERNHLTIRKKILLHHVALASVWSYLFSPERAT
jgi:hypothetical protein